MVSWDTVESPGLTHESESSQPEKKIWDKHNPDVNWCRAGTVRELSWVNWTFFLTEQKHLTPFTELELNWTDRQHETQVNWTKLNSSFCCFELNWTDFWTNCASKKRYLSKKPYIHSSALRSIDSDSGRLRLRLWLRSTCHKEHRGLLFSTNFFPVNWTELN